ncbi:MAG: hypothetical protein IJ484_08785 [Oscillospiraceae bacterium]|nr:hypothetical protein [Oscillospiraceae bacterium]
MFRGESHTVQAVAQADGGHQKCRQQPAQRFAAAGEGAFGSSHSVSTSQSSGTVSSNRSP